MASYHNVTEFAGKVVVDWDPAETVTDPADPIYRIALDYESGQRGTTWPDKFSAFLEHSASKGATGLVVGIWESWTRQQELADRVVEAIVSAREKLPDLTAIYFGDIVSEECEISWIAQTDVSPLFTAYPALEYFIVRGGNGLSLGTPRLPALRSLVVETGGMSAEIVHSISKSDLPALEHLELWLGDSSYGATSTVEDLEPILSGRLFPNLKYLGLRDSEFSDDIAAALVTAPILERLEILDLSMGTLSDKGMEALLASPNLTRLKKLDINFHYCSDAMVARLEALDIEVDAGDQQEEDDDYRYVAVGE